VEVVISPKAAELTGVAPNPNTGNPMPGAMVVLIPQDKTAQGAGELLQIDVSDQNGAFSLTGLTPGD
jgi:hypothetical protein